jgi:diguanylate cyclase (GGDEF)-like protein/PAS domain S-box-containing protein
MNTPVKSVELLAKELRHRAEVKLTKKTAPNDSAAQKMLHELQVHQIELEMQNEELHQAQKTQKLHYRFTELFEFAPIGYFSFDINTIINQVNFRGAKLLGIERAHLVNTQFLNYVNVQYRDSFKSCLVKAFSDTGIQSCEILAEVGTKKLWLSIEANLGITGTDCLVAVTDISDRKKIEHDQKLAHEEKEKLTDELALAAKVFTHSREGILITDADGIIIEVNDAFTNITGYSREDSLGKNPSFIQSERHSTEFYSSMWETIAVTGEWYGEITNKRKDGVEYPEIMTICAVHNDAGELQNFLAMFGDMSQMKSKIKKLEHITHYDLLTNLPNRVLLADRLTQAMLQCNRRQQSLAVVFLDLDGFKQVNDSHGHHVGDELLIALSIRMKDALREGDTLARFGGDEFVAVLTDLAKVEDCKLALERLLLAASEPVALGNLILSVTASIGATLYPQDNVSADGLIRHADQAMYVAKESGKNCYHLFDTAGYGAIKLHLDNLKAIRSALDKDEFVLHYQPKVNMRTGLVTGVEALIRWQHPQRGLLGPFEFLPLIENNPMSIEMGEWVIETALKQISQWQTMGLILPTGISVNIAAIQLQQVDFTKRLTRLLAAHSDVEARYLELEILETSALDDVIQISTTMNDCMALGVNFSLDDFGTGYSSLTYLRRLPASLIKIDQSFVRDMLINVDDLAIVQGVIALAKSFKREVIAEGVETIEHGKALLQLGCELAQGYGIARPMPASDIPAWISRWEPDISWKI